MAFLFRTGCALSICLHLTTVHPDKLEIFCMKCRPNIVNTQSLVLDSKKSPTDSNVTKALPSRWMLALSYERHNGKGGVAEGKRPLVSFSLQQLHLLLSTAQHQRAREDHRIRDRSQGQDVTSNPEPTSQSSKTLWDVQSQLWEQKSGSDTSQAGPLFLAGLQVF